MINFLTDFFNNLTWALVFPGIVAGVVLMLAGKFLPAQFLPYKVVCQILGLAMVVFFVFQSGRHSEYNTWQQTIAEQKVEIARLQVESEKINTVYVTKYRDKIKEVIKWRSLDVKNIIPAEADKVCKIDEVAPKFRNLVDAAAEGIDPSKIGVKR